MNVFNLFKYYKPKYEGKDNLSFYSEKSIYFQKPVEFNDPWDCKAPHLKISRDFNVLKNIWFNFPRNKIDPNLVKARWQEYRDKYSRAEIVELLKKKFEDAFEKRRSEIGVFSLSFIPDSELMWSHYASSHSGYMLHFQIDIDQYCANSSLKNEFNLCPVIYRDKREVWDLENYHIDGLRFAYGLTRIKSNAWACECELRLINQFKYGFFKIPSNWLKSIVIGIDIDGELRGKLKNIGNALKIPVLSSVMNEKEYKIDIPGLKINGNDGRTCYKKVIESKRFELEPGSS